MKTGAGYAGESSFQLLAIRCETSPVRQMEIVHQVRIFAERRRNESGHAVLDDGADFFIGQEGQYCFACDSAVRVETSAARHPRGDDGVRAIHSIEAHDASGSWHGDAHSFILRCNSLNAGFFLLDQLTVFF